MGAVHLPLPLCQRRILTLRRRHGSSLCSQSEGDEPMANNATNSAVAALSSSRPSLCKQSELQCFAPVGDHAALRRPVPNPCQRTRAVRRPPLGRATTVSGPCDVRTPYRVRHQTVASCRSIPFLRFPLAAPPFFFYFYPAGKASADGKSKWNGSFNTIFTPFRLTIDK